MTTTYQVQVSKPYPRSVQVEPNHYAELQFVDVAVPEIGFTATVEYTTDAKLKTALKPLLQQFMEKHTTRILEVTV